MENQYLVALNRIRAIVDAYKEKRIHITVGNDDFNKETHTYDVSAVMGVIGNYINDALRDTEILEKGGEKDEFNKYVFVY